jgi:phosphatidylinositol alpha-1,6-mannosyltransferase
MLALVTDAFGGRGGIAQYNRDFLGALAASGTVSTLKILPRNAPDPVVVPPGIVQEQSAGRSAYVLAALRIALSEHIDIVFCGHINLAPLAAGIARLAGAKLVMQTHGIEAWPHPSRLARAAFESADLVLCVSRYTRAAVLGWASIAPERVMVLPNTVGERFTPGDASDLRRAWGIEGRRVLLSVGRMDSRERYKGHDRTIAAIPMLVAAGVDVIYVVLGEGNDRPRLEALANGTGVADRVRFVGAQDSGTVVAAYRMADLFVMPSTGEGFGIAFLEAMACGTPALGLGVAGACDALVDGQLGIMVTEAGFATALASALQRTKPDAGVLHAGVLDRFGPRCFAAGTQAVLSRLTASV